MPGVPVITGTTEPAAFKVIEQSARAQAAPLILVSQADVHQLALDNLRVPLLGRHQQLNAALAMATVHTLSNHIPLSTATIRTGLSTMNWPGRLQLMAC